MNTAPDYFYKLPWATTTTRGKKPVARF